LLHAIEIDFETVGISRLGAVEDLGYEVPVRIVIGEIASKLDTGIIPY
jgi:hypothetical protein